MSLAPVRVGDDPYRLLRRTVWIAYVAVLVAAAFFHAGKAAQERGAFVRWRHQIHEFWHGENIWDKYFYPNPPILPITLSPLMVLPPVTGAMAWFALKAGLACASALACFRMARAGDRPLPAYVQFSALLLSLRPILSDLHHGNNNLVILGLVVAVLMSWRRGYDVLAGLALALAISFKVTPALFVPYFLYRRSWRTVGATLIGMGLFLLVVPALVLGPEFNGQCLAMWWHRILSPFVAKGVVTNQEVNQSMVGVLTRLLTEGHLADEHGYNGVQARLNLVAWDPQLVVWLLKGLSVALVGLLAVLCRTKAARRDDPRLLGEFSLVVLTMLFVSERSWKHHFVTILLPAAYLACRMGLPAIGRRARWLIAGALVASALLMATTSTDLGGFFTRRIDPDLIPTAGPDGGSVAASARETIDGHIIAQYYGMFFWGGVVLYAATAWRVLVERDRSPFPEPDGAGPEPDDGAAPFG